MNKSTSFLHVKPTLICNEESQKKFTSLARCFFVAQLSFRALILVTQNEVASSGATFMLNVPELVTVA